MTRLDRESIERAIAFAARFGFLSRGLFFSEVCRESRTQRYRKWKLLGESGFFRPVPYAGTCVYLTAKAKYEFGLRDVFDRPNRFFRHDECVARVMGAVDRTGLFPRAVTELELRSSSLLAYRLFDSERIEKLPDVAFETSSDGRWIALEIELTLKARDRYSRMVLGLAHAPNIRTVLFGCERESIASAIHRAFKLGGLCNHKYGPFTFLTPEFDLRGLDCALMGSTAPCSLGNMLRSVCELGTNPGFPSRDGIQGRVA